MIDSDTCLNMGFLGKSNQMGTLYSLSCLNYKEFGFAIEGQLKERIH